jgi:flagellar biosynthetic protein FlhB
MAENQDSNERTEQPTARRKQQSREKGQVPRSRELNTMLSLLTAALALTALGSPIAGQFSGLIGSALDFGRQAAYDKAFVTLHFAELGLSSLVIFAPFFAVMIIGAFAGPLLMGGWSFSASAMAFKFEKLNPVQGLKRIFSAKGLLELVKALFKFLILIAATVLLFDLYLGNILNLGSIPTLAAVLESTGLLLWSLLLLSFTLVFIVMFDVPFELWDHTRQLKMTRQEVRDELKETEGRPEVKGRIRSLQREASQRRMMDAVPEADVVITNPTHFSIALRYEDVPGAAPRVVAKGRDLVALKIRSVAIEHDVAVFSAPPLARALYRSAEIGDEIPPQLYLAVARVLAYIYQLKSAGVNDQVMPPLDIEVPEEFRDSGNDGAQE